MTQHRSAETRLSAARARLILERPFLGAIVLRLPLKQGDGSWCQTTATDARHFYYNPGYINQLSLSQIEFALAHEALHCALSHFARRHHREKKRWDAACDFAVNPILINEGLTPPPNILYLDAYDGMSAEEIYPLLDDESLEQGHDDHAYDGGDSAQPHECGDGGRPPPLSPEEKEGLAQQWQQRLAGAAQQAMQAGKLSAHLQRLIDHLLQPQLPWRMLLARYMTLRGREDFIYSRPSRREGEAIFPVLRSAELNVVIAIDTSGSIREQEMDAFVSEVNAIKGQMRARIQLLACDSELASNNALVFEPWEEFVLPEALGGGGGTRFEPVFDWVAEQDTDPDLVVYFTDGQGTFPDDAPHYPVIWLVKGRADVPWGQRVQLN